MGHRGAAPGGAAGEHAGEVLGPRRGLCEAAAQLPHRSPVGPMQAAACEVAVPDGGGVVAGMVLGDDQVDPVIGAQVGAGGVTGVAVDVADLLPGQQAAAELPGLAVVVGDEIAGVIVYGAHEAVQHAVQTVHVLVGDAAPAAEGPHLLRGLEQSGPVQRSLLAPDSRVGGLADPPAGEVVALVTAVDGDPAPVGPAPQRRVVVVIGFEALMEHDGAGGARFTEPVEVHHVQVHVPSAPLAVGPAGGGDCSEQQRAGRGVDQGALVLEPAPAAVVADQRGAGGGGGG